MAGPAVYDFTNFLGYSTAIQYEVWLTVKNFHGSVIKMSNTVESIAEAYVWLCGSVLPDDMEVIEFGYKQTFVPVSNNPGTEI